jgi:hypothetical protein
VGGRQGGTASKNRNGKRVHCWYYKKLSLRGFKDKKTRHIGRVFYIQVPVCLSVIRKSVWLPLHFQPPSAEHINLQGPSSP